MIAKHLKLLLVLAAAVLLVIGSVVYNEWKAAAAHARTDANWSLIVPAISASDHTIGNVDAPIQVIVYADYQCAFCGRFFRDTQFRLQEEFGDKIVIAYRHLPIINSEKSAVEAEASECVYQLGGNEAFWRFTRAMFADPDSQKSFDVSTLPEIAISAGVERSDYEECMAEGRGKDPVERDLMQGSIAGLNLTPSIVLKSQYRALIVKGDYPAQLSAGISYLLKTNDEIEWQKSAP